MTNPKSKTNINILGLPEIFQGISERRQNGTLKVQSGKNAYYVYFSQGNIRLCATSNEASLLVKALQHCFYLDEEAVSSVFSRYCNEDIPLFDLLIEIGLTHKSIIELCQFQIREEIWRIFLWEDIFCEFTEGFQPPDVFDNKLIDLPIDISAESILLDSARCCDEWNVIKECFPSMMDVPFILREYHKEHGIEGTAELIHILNYIDGIKDFEEITDEVRLPFLQAMKILFELAEKGFLELKTAKELLELASKITKEKNIFKCIKLYERAEELGERNLLTMHWLAEAYELSGRIFPNCVNKYREIGAFCMGNTDFEGAVIAFQKTISYAPEDWDTYEKMIRCLRQIGRTEEAADIANIYAKKLSLENEKRAISILKEANEYFSKNTDNLKLLGSLYVRIGDRIDAILSYEQLAGIYKERGDFERCITAYQDILRIDSENIEARVDLARTLLSYGKKDEALKEYKFLGKTLHSPENISNAFACQNLIEVCTEIIRLEPNNVAARGWLVDAYLFRKDRNKARVILQELITLLGNEDLTVMIDYIKKMAELAPEDIDYRKKLAESYMKLRHTDEAKTEYLTLGVAALEKGDLNTALTAFDSVLSVDSFNIFARHKKAEILARLGYKEEALKEYELVGYMSKAIECYDLAMEAFSNYILLAPEEKKNHTYILGGLALTAGRKSLANYYYRKFINLALGIGNFADALEVCKILLSINPDMKDIQILQQTLNIFLSQNRELRDLHIEEGHEEIIDI